MRLAFAALAFASPLVAQATTVSAPTDNYLLEITQEWGKVSSLGDLRMMPMASEDREVRLWVGYGLTSTRGVILRQHGGAWQGWHVTVVRCLLVIPFAIGDTIGPESTLRYQAEAKAQCGKRSAPEGRVISTDTLQVRPLAALQHPDSLWEALIAKGLLRLPPSVPRSWMMEDGTTYVLEVRAGEKYRASVIELTTPPEGNADRDIQALAAILGPYL